MTDQQMRDTGLTDSPLHATTTTPRVKVGCRTFWDTHEPRRSCEEIVNALDEAGVEWTAIYDGDGSY